jgi:hypothetical protein
VEGLEEVEHRPVLVLEQSAGDVHGVVGRDPHEVLVERTMVDRAETDTVRDGRESLRFDVGGDVRSVEQPLLLQPADGALTTIRGDNPAAETRLMDSDARLSPNFAQSTSRDAKQELRTSSSRAVIRMRSRCGSRPGAPSARSRG